MSGYAYTLNATVRKDSGKGASRRLRHQGLVPAIVYGGEGEPLPITLVQNELVRWGRFDSFYSQVINLKVEGQPDQEVIVRAVQRHLYKPLYQHLDLQRVVKGQELQTTVVLHFINEDICAGVKQNGGIVEHLLNNVEIIAEPRNLPENIQVDMTDVAIGEAVRLRDLKLPKGVRLAHDDERADGVVAQVIYPQLHEEEEAGAPASEGPATSEE